MHTGTQICHDHRRCTAPKQFSKETLSSACHLLNRVGHPTHYCIKHTVTHPPTRSLSCMNSYPYSFILPDS